MIMYFYDGIYCLLYFNIHIDDILLIYLKSINMYSICLYTY